MGIDSGVVLAGQVGSDVFSEYTMLGDAANTAARLEGSAPPGEVLISQEMSYLVRNAVELESFGPLTLKGKAEPVTAYLVRGESPELGASTRGLEEVETPLVGRAGETARLVSAFEDAMESKCLVWYTLTGDAGIGKSRLTDSFLDAIRESDHEARIVRGRCIEQVKDSYALIRSMLTNCYEIKTGIAPDEARSRLSEAIAADLSGNPFLHAENAASDVAHLLFPSTIDDDDPRARSERARAALEALVLAWAEKEPLVLVLEDIHWADGASLDALARLAERLAKQQSFILANARPLLFVRRPHWGEGELGHIRLDLKPLSRAAIGRLVRAILGGDVEAPERIVDFVTERSEGNAYYVEELMQMLRIRGIIARSEKEVEGSGSSEESSKTVWTVDEARLDEGRVPTTLRGMLQARLDALEAGERHALQLASVLGRVFWEEALSALDDSATSQLQALRTRGLILIRDRSSFPGQKEYVFRHALLCDAAYTTLLKRSRPPLHARAATWIEEASKAGERYGELAARIAWHADLAKQPADAARHYLVAADRARASYANSDALKHYDRALELWPEEDKAGCFEVLKGRELIHDLLGDRDAQSQGLDALQELAKELDSDCQSYVHFERSWFLLRTGNPEEAEQEARLALTCADETGKPCADAYLNLGNALNRLGRYEDAIEAFENALEIYNGLGQDRSVAKAVVGRASAARDAKRFEVAVRDFEQAYSIFVSLGDLTGQAVNSNNLAILHAMQGSLAEAKPYFERALTLYRGAGNLTGEGKALHNLGFLASEQSDFSGAEGLMREALALFRLSGQKADEESVLKDLDSVLSAQEDQRVILEESTAGSPRD